MEGKGIFKFVDGDVYEGDSKNNKHHGIGIYTYPNGRKEKQEWKNGELKRVIEVLKGEKDKKCIVFWFIYFLYLFYLFIYL
jgi:hypothetical protein